MPVRVEVVLNYEEREVLQRWARRPKSAQALALRCRIVLVAAEGERSKDIAARLGCSSQTVGRWRGRFAKRGLDGLHDEPRPGKPRSITDEDVERVIVKTLEEQPPNATHWSTRCRGSPSATPRLRAQRDHESLRRARRRLRSGDYRDDAPPPRRGVPPLPQPDREFGASPPRRSRRARQLFYPQDSVDSALALAPSVLYPALHATYSSWLNLVERWFAELTTKWIKRSSHRSVRDLVASIRTWIANWNEEPKPYVWHKRRRRDPRQPRLLLPADQRLRSLALKHR